MRKSFAIPFLFVVFIAAACTDQAGSDYASGQPGEGKPGNLQWVTINDMTENSFSIEAPAGWQNAALLHRLHNSPRSLVTTVAPDKNTVVYLGDPTLPVYSFPNPQMEASYRQLGLQPPFKSMDFMTAEDYFSDYLQRRFGNLDGFRMLEKFDNKPLLDRQAREMQKLSIQMHVTNVSYRFKYTSNGRTIHGELNGCTVSTGTGWLPEVSGFCTAGDAGKAENILLKMIDSRVNNPKWQEEQNAKHQQTMAMIEQNTRRMTQQHEQNMAAIQSSSAAHQQRMANLQQSHDEWNKNWSANQAAQDRQHERFVNTIKGEHTVQDEEGNTYQVDNSQSRYFVDKDNNTYIGADATVSLDDLRKIKEINIEHFEEVQIIR